MKCPVCKLDTGRYYLPDSGGEGRRFNSYPLYQRSYVEKPRQGLITCHIIGDGDKPISPRCLKCYETVEERQLKRAR